MTPSDYYTSSAWEAAHQGYNTKAGAAAAQQLQPHPYNWYVWQMHDGRWHLSLMTSRVP